MQLYQSGIFWASSEYQAFDIVIIFIERNLFIISLLFLTEGVEYGSLKKIVVSPKKWWWVAGGANNATKYDVIDCVLFA